MKKFLNIVFLLLAMNSLHAQNINLSDDQLPDANLVNFQSALSIRNSFSSFRNAYQGEDELGIHIISVRPIGVLKRDWQDPIDTAIAISYEQILGSGRFAIRVPLEIGIHSKSFFISPTLKMYARKQGAVRYAIGPQLTFGSGLHNVELYNSLYSTKIDQVRRTQIGIMLNNSLNITVAKKFYVGLDLGFGAMVYNSVKSDNDAAVLAVIFFGPVGLIGLITPSMQGGLSLGYRF